jgi:hypothetical protein
VPRRQSAAIIPRPKLHPVHRAGQVNGRHAACTTSPIRDILEFFFQIHDPTTKNRQGNDFGSGYRSEVFYTSEEQRQLAEDTIAHVDA